MHRYKGHNEMNKNDTVKIFIDGAICCSVPDCFRDCEGYAFIEKKWFYENYLKISGFSNKEEFFSNYLYPDAEKIVESAIKNNKLISLSTPCNCNEFNLNQKIKNNNFINYYLILLFLLGNIL